jgi:hypothetical protein
MELGRLTAHKAGETSGVLRAGKLRGRPGSVIDPIEGGHPVFCASGKNVFLSRPHLPKDPLDVNLAVVLLSKNVGLTGFSWNG